MKMFTNENLHTRDRITRVIIGTILAMSPLFIAENVAFFTATVFASFYPLLTGLVGIDPVLRVFAMVNLKSALIKKKSIPTPHIVQ